MYVTNSEEALCKERGPNQESVEVNLSRLSFKAGSSSSFISSLQ